MTLTIKKEINQKRQISDNIKEQIALYINLSVTSMVLASTSLRDVHKT